MPVELHDAVVTLRPWTLQDAPWYVECTMDPEVQRFTTDPPTLTAEDVAAAISALAVHPERLAYLVADRASGQRLGNLALDRADDVGDVSYWIAAAARGRGVATRALELLAAAAFEHLDLRKLRLWAHAANTASRRVAERAGFRRDPARDQTRAIKGETWPTVAYVRLR
ncbi:GNAT family N-acetyltransferase [Modestobacter sp. DSM 44400]|uniref:GNAT family N-acetyltransferase n=1 Tax=Modestobacter sp. DSM 44400 TaxID=1550230 RepID=UPI00111513EE|nr:GNAT family protein [Modestobacter sp. DSM 44400]